MCLTLINPSTRRMKQRGESVVVQLCSGQYLPFPLMLHGSPEAEDFGVLDAE